LSRVRVAVVLLVSCFAPAQIVSSAQTATESHQSAAELYRSACAACHGPDGKGSPPAAVGFDLPLPDFSDCEFASPEADADWIAVVHQGGKARAFDRMMPAFGEALSIADIERVVGHLRSFCREPGWPRGELNLPRPLVTEKAYPENELVVTTTVRRGEQDAVTNQVLYERRLGRRGQYEVSVPFDLLQTDTGQWLHGIGDIALGYKHVIFDTLTRGAIMSCGGELVLPTGSERDGLGEGATIVEPFATFSQILPRDTFLHLHAGLELPVRDEDATTAAFWRAAFGKTLIQRRWYRSWSPMFELLGSRDLADEERVMWDVVPQMQVSLSTRQHVLLAGGLRIPVNQREQRGNTLMVYLLWDWFDGGFFTGW